MDTNEEQFFVPNGRFCYANAGSDRTGRFVAQVDVFAKFRGALFSGPAQSFGRKRAKFDQAAAANSSPVLLALLDFMFSRNTQCRS
jgi:hypothetical protein